VIVARYMPSIVLAVWVLLLISGVSEELVRLPGLASLGAALAIMARAEIINSRSERRRYHDRRH
jgi:hypothetical protein